jgi:Protein of unknown function (DUF3632)
MSESTAEEIRNHHERFLQECLADFDTEIAGHPPNESTKDFLIAIKSFMIGLNESFSFHHESIDLIEQDLHHIWHMVIEVAKLTPSEEGTQESLVFLLLHFKELGTLHKNVKGGEQEAVMENGMKVWKDLPYFATCLMIEWQKMAGMTAVQRVNLAAFTGKGVALGVGGDNVALCALLLLREALQLFARPEESGRELVVQLLPACTVLLQQCGHKLLTLCISNKKLEQHDMRSSVHGQQAVRELEQADFDVGRWFCWRKAFQELSRSKDVVIATEAKRSFDSMIRCGRELGCVVEGEEKHWERVKIALTEELNRSGKESVDLEDIVTEPDWVD